MNPRSRAHPIGQALNAAALGHPPTARELDALDLTPGVRRRLEDAAGEVAALRAEGANQIARSHADEHAANLIAALPEAQRDPDYLDPPDPLADSTDPAALANAISRH